jgi:uncharacterized protein associated with vWA-MoxR-VMAP ternary system
VSPKSRDRSDNVSPRDQLVVSQLVADLASPVNATAQRALAGQDWDGIAKEDTTSIVTTFAALVTSANLLSPRSQAARMRQLLSRVPAHSVDFEALMRVARDFPPHLRTTVAAALPETLRPALYRGASETSRSGFEVSDGSVEQADKPSSRLDTERANAGRGADTEGMSHAYTTVLALSNPDRQDANIKTLRREGLDIRLVESMSELELALTRASDVCLCIVDGSVLRTLDAEAQRRLFTILGEYSTFVRIRVHDSELMLARREVRQIVRNVRALTTEVPPAALCFDSDGTIRPTEVEDLKEGHDQLQSHHNVRFVVGELSVSQAHLLVAASRARMESDQLTGPLEIRSLTTRFMGGGRSGARLAAVRVNDAAASFVARITTTPAAVEEMKRFATFIHSWDPQLQPQLHYHRNDAAILYALVARDAARLQPADMLEDRLAELWNDQWLGLATDGDLERRAETLASGLEWATARLAVLNGTRCVGSFESVGNPTVERIAQLEAQGFDMGFGRDVARAREIAVSRFGQLAHVAVMHGDIHLRNMLVGDDSRVHFIDYGSAGPGHPAVDLVRLEVSLYTGQARQVESEPASIELQRALSVHCASLDVLRRQFSPFFQCRVNEVCAHAMVAARDGAVDAVRAHGGNIRDYQAAKYLVAWQHVGMNGVHTGLARSSVAALTDEILSW